jgi:prepilin-type N-terminal cleavage/methylation domain-containing protein
MTRILTPMRSPAARAGFTLVELLVVIAIIAILFSLTTAAVVKVIATADETANRTEISKLEAAVRSFQSHYGVKYVPSRIRLLENGNYNMSLTAAGTPVNQLDHDSLTYLKQVWPKLTFPVDWNGDGTAGNSDATLQGDQCLVFFLGGIPAQNAIATTGFSTNPKNPAWHIRNGGDVVQPFYEFKSNRLVRLHGNRFFSYLDNYGRGDGNGNLLNATPPYKPFAYFSSSKAGNDYTRYGDGPTSDCALLGVSPYREPGTNPVIFHNREGFQIISAGPDRLFGPGGVWSPSTAGGIPQAGRDDQANFYDRRLGASQ